MRLPRSKPISPSSALCTSEMVDGVVDMYVLDNESMIVIVYNQLGLKIPNVNLILFRKEGDGDFIASFIKELDDNVKEKNNYYCH